MAQVSLQVYSCGKAPEISQYTQSKLPSSVLDQMTEDHNLEPRVSTYHSAGCTVQDVILDAQCEASSRAGYETLHSLPASHMDYAG